MENYKWPFVSCIVVDWSWAFIHSFSLEWNDMPIDKYLQLEFEYCETLDRSILHNVIKIKICYAHYMHIVSRTVDKKFGKLKKHKNIILEIFSLMCLSTDFDEFDLIFHNLCFILLSKNKIKADSSMQAIAQFTKRHSTEFNDVAKKTFDFLENCDDIEIDDDTPKNSMYSKSPFYEKYNKMVAVIEVELEKNEHDDEVSNEMFMPEFICHILTLWLPYMPLWTAVDLNLIDPKISRLTNAYIESTHKVNKDYVVQNTKNTSIGDVVRLLKHRRKNVLSRVYLNVDLKGKKNNKKPHYPETTSNPNVKEQWKNKYSKSKGHDKSTNLQEIHESNNVINERIIQEKILDENSEESDYEINNLTNLVSEKMKNRKRRKGKQGRVSNKKTKKSSDSDSRNVTCEDDDYEKNDLQNILIDPNFSSTSLKDTE